MRAQQRQQFDRRRHADEGVVEMGERAVGIGRAAERHEQRRRQFGQHLAGAGAGDGGAAAEMPAAHGLGRRLGVAEAELAAGSPASPDRRLGAGEDEVPASAARLGPSSNSSA